MSAQWTGLAEAKAAIRALGELAAPQVLASALRQVGHPIKDEMAAAAPVDTGETSKDFRVGVAEDERGEVSMLIGPRGTKIGRAYIVRFIEFGTAHQPARPFMRPVWERHRGRVSGDVAAALRPAYERTVRRLVRVARRAKQ